MQNDDARIVDILIAAEEIADFIRNRVSGEYRTNRMLQAAVERNVFVIGEACRALSDAFKQQHSSMPWAKIIGTRNILAHEYGRVNHDIMWEIASVHVPNLASYLKPFTPTQVEE